MDVDSDDIGKWCSMLLRAVRCCLPSLSLYMQSPSGVIVPPNRFSSSIIRSCSLGAAVDTVGYRLNRAKWTGMLLPVLLLVRVSSFPLPFRLPTLPLLSPVLARNSATLARAVSGSAYDLVRSASEISAFPTRALKNLVLASSVGNFSVLFCTYATRRCFMSLGGPRDTIEGTRRARWVVSRRNSTVYMIDFRTQRRNADSGKVAVVPPTTSVH